MPTRSNAGADGLCTWAACTLPATARVRCRNVLGQPTAEAYWMCEEHARKIVEHCPRGDYIDARKDGPGRGR